MQRDEQDSPAGSHWYGTQTFTRIGAVGCFLFIAGSLLFGFFGVVAADVRGGGSLIVGISAVAVLVSLPMMLVGRGTRYSTHPPEWAATTIADRKGQWPPKRQDVG